MDVNTLPNKTTLPAEWLVLAEAYGGVSRLQEEIGLPAMTFWRIARGVVRPRPIVVKLVERLAREKNIPSPFDKPTVVEHVAVHRKLDENDLRALELMGENLARGRFVPEKTLEYARKNFPERELVRLADDDSASTNVQRAVAHLLGLFDRD
jgi:hypothetical protein